MTQLDIPHSLHFLPPRVFSSFRSNFPPFRINACSEKASRDRARFDSTRGLGTIQEPIPRRPDESKLATYGRGPTYISYISYIIYIIHYIYIHTHTRERERERERESPVGHGFNCVLATQGWATIRLAAAPLESICGCPSMPLAQIQNVNLDPIVLCTPKTEPVC